MVVSNIQIVLSRKINLLQWSATECQAIKIRFYINICYHKYHCAIRVNKLVEGDSVCCNLFQVTILIVQFNLIVIGFVVC